MALNISRGLLPGFSVASYLCFTVLFTLTMCVLLWNTPRVHMSDFIWSVQFLHLYGFPAPCSTVNSWGTCCTETNLPNKKPGWSRERRIESSVADGTLSILIFKCPLSPEVNTQADRLMYKIFLKLFSPLCSSALQFLYTFDAVQQKQKWKDTIYTFSSKSANSDI